MCNDITELAAASFLSHVADSSGLCYNTIRTYRSALGTWWQESTVGVRSPEVNPFRSPYVKRVLSGIERSMAPALIQARQQRAQLAPEVTLDAALLADLLPHMHTDSSSGFMQWSATRVGVYGLLRRVELLGSSDHRDRYLKPTQIAFYDTPAKLQRIALRSPTRSPAGTAAVTHDHGPQPAAFTIDLGMSKADAMGTNPPHLVSHPAAVRTLWCWMHMRAALTPGTADDALFQVPGQPRLEMKQLLRSLSTAYELARDTPAPHFAGKIFRRSGASNLLIAGADGPELQTAGRWRSPQMPLLYASMTAKVARVALDLRSPQAK